MKINEIFTSVEGEVSRWHQGGISTFIRLQGCNLSCDWCDTVKSQSMNGGREMSWDDIMVEVLRRGVDRVTITGGEPMLQWTELNILIGELTKNRIRVSIETNGTLPIPYLALRHPFVGWVIDYKLQYRGTMAVENFQSLPSTNWVKIVVKDREEYDKAKEVMTWLEGSGCEARVALSPADSEPAFALQLTKWILIDGLSDVFLNLQIHKLIGAE